MRPAQLLRVGALLLTAFLLAGCPVTLVWRDWQKHREAGGSRETFTPRYGQGDLVNFFWRRRPGRQTTRRGDAAPPQSRSDGATS